MVQSHCILLALWIPTAWSFSKPQPHFASKKSRLFQRSVFEKELKSLYFNPMEGYHGVNLDRAHECADHFGACSVEEMEDLRSNLHQERLQHAFVGVFADSPKDFVKGTEVVDLEHRVLEEELELQLALLRTHDSSNDAGSSLFPPPVEETMQELPHLKDGKQVLKKQNSKTRSSQNAMIMEESVLETAAMCLAVTVLMLVPNLAQNF